jgi:APA family basic amino acid/polyamine antiporter
VYTVVAVSALAAVGPSTLAHSAAPLAAATGSGSLAWLSPAVRIGGTVASLGVLVSLLAGVSRTAFSMARHHDLPGSIGAVHPRFRTPHRAELAVAIVVVALVLLVDLRGALGFSSFEVLVYYGIANAAASTQPRRDRRLPRALQVVGIVGCALLAFTLPVASVLSGLAVLAVGAVVWLARRGPSFVR